MTLEALDMARYDPGGSRYGPDDLDMARCPGPYIWPDIASRTRYMASGTLDTGYLMASGTLDTGYLPGYHKSYTLVLGTPSHLDIVHA